MKDRDRLQALADLAAMLRDRRLEALRQAALAREETRARIAGLAAAEASDLSPVAAALAGVAYQRWADRARADLNTRLARQTAEWMERQAEARQAFGKAQVLERLSARPPR